MVSKITLAEILLSGVVLIAVLHTVFHLSVYGTGIPGAYEQGISGLAVGKTTIGQDLAGTRSLVPLSHVLLFAEWTLVIIMIVFFILEQKLELRREVVELHLNDRYTEGSVKTDLDVLHDLLKEKKHLKVSAVARVFNVQTSTVMDWCAILEMGNLATLHYPRIGEPELILKA